MKVDNSAILTYKYDAQGRRIQSPTYDSLYDLNGNAVALFTLSGIWSYGEIYAGAWHLATYAAGTTNFLHDDWLGTRRVATGVTGSVADTCTSLVFGDGSTCTGADPNLNHFTDYAHDAESNLEHAPYRQYSTTQGRFLTPDPYAGSMDISSPQSLSRYTYVLGNPTNMVDPFGLIAEKPCDPGSSRNELGKCVLDSGLGGGAGPVPGGGGGLPGNPSGGGGGNRGSQKHSKEHDKCVRDAVLKANYQADEEIFKNFAKPFKAGFKGAIGSGIIGCVITIEGGCWEGAITGALVGASGGILEGGGEALIDDLAASATAISEMNKEIAACPQ